MAPWRPTKEWAGETAFIVGGGPSALHADLSTLRGRKVIAINSSWRAMPWADFLVFSDNRWWAEHGPILLDESQRQRPAVFGGRIVAVTTTITLPVLYEVGRENKPGLCRDPGAVMIRRTTLTAALNLAYHLGASRMILLGVDGKAAENGRTHHHEAHPWPQRPGCWDEQRVDVAAIAADLAREGIKVINASPGSALDLWKVLPLPDAIALFEAQRRCTVDPMPVPAGMVLIP